MNCYYFRGMVFCGTNNFFTASQLTSGKFAKFQNLKCFIKLCNVVSLFKLIFDCVTVYITPIENILVSRNYHRSAEANGSNTFLATSSLSS